jgi:hypothetical protein
MLCRKLRRRLEMGARTEQGRPVALVVEVNGEILPAKNKSGTS